MIWGVIFEVGEGIWGHVEGPLRHLELILGALGALGGHWGSFGGPWGISVALGFHFGCYLQCFAIQKYLRILGRTCCCYL